MKNLFKRNISMIVAKVAIVLCTSLLFSSCVLVVLGIEAAKDKKDKKKAAKNAAMAKSRFVPAKATGMCILCTEPETVTFGSKRDLKLVLSINDSTGKKYPYYAGGEQLQWSDFSFNIQGGYIDDKGKLTVDRRLEKCPGGKIIIKASYKNKPGIDTTLVFDLLMKKETPAGFAGKKGPNGYSGRSGSTGRTGNSGNSGDTGCTEGGEGSMGGNGENGSDGPEVVAYIKKAKFANLDREVIIVKSINLTNPDTSISYFDLSKESIVVYANGGDGGHGGSGGAGGTGGHWNGPNSASSYMCKGGRGGDAGNGADGGNGGSLKVYLDPSAETVFNKFKFNTEGGAPGKGGYAGPGGYGNKPYSQSPNGRPGQDGRKGQRGQKAEVIKQKLADDAFK